MPVIETTPDVQVRKAGRGDAATVSRIGAAAFHDDVVGRWLIPDEKRRHRRFPDAFRLYFDAYLPHDETYVNVAGTGAALWLPAGRELFPTEEAGERFMSGMAEIAGPTADRWFTLEEVFTAHLPAEPHMHLQILAVVPEAQGRGIGSALMATVFERADREGVAAYLEATCERNRALYERHGFECRGLIPLPDGPTLFAMWREPR
jgi:ribosomal protein S18 acetylase RimI-like enzyme